MIKSGSCGKNLTWTLDKDGTLTIKGTGEMKNYAGSDNPWNRLRVETVVIQQGLTSIGKEAFRDCSGLTSIELPESVTSIGKYAFRGCSGLTSIVLPEGVTSIGDSAFIYPQRHRLPNPGGRKDGPFLRLLE